MKKLALLALMIIAISSVGLVMAHESTVNEESHSYSNCEDMGSHENGCEEGHSDHGHMGSHSNHSNC